MRAARRFIVYETKPTRNPKPCQRITKRTHPYGSQIPDSKLEGGVRQLYASASLQFFLRNEPNGRDAGKKRQVSSYDSRSNAPPSAAPELPNEAIRAIAVFVTSRETRPDPIRLNPTFEMIFTKQSQVMPPIQGQGVAALCLGLSYYRPFRTRVWLGAEINQTKPFALPAGSKFAKRSQSETELASHLSTKSRQAQYSDLTTNFYETNPMLDPPQI